MSKIVRYLTKLCKSFVKRFVKTSKFLKFYHSCNRHKLCFKFNSNRCRAKKYSYLIK